MTIQRCEMPSFAVIGKEGKTTDGENFIAKLWESANGHFDEIAHLASKDEQGILLGIWGAMSDFTRSFLPWENNFSQGLYLAGAQCEMDAEAPEGWVKWVIPGYVYLYAENEGPGTFTEVLNYMQESGLELAGAVHDYFCPQTGKSFMFFPIEKR